jgi:heme-degrading monooxygenase HmoA
MQLKPNSAAEFTKRLDKDMIPLLRKQKGFQDLIAFLSAAGNEAFGISLWDRPEDAEAYERATYPEVAKLLATVVEGTPRVEIFEVSNSTFHKIAATFTPPPGLLHARPAPTR